MTGAGWFQPMWNRPAWVAALAVPGNQDDLLT